MENINRRKALVVTGAGIAAALTASPALAGQSELESLIATYDAARADYDQVYVEFAVAERKYNQWKETAQFPLVQFMPGVSVDAEHGYETCIELFEPDFNSCRDRLARMFSGQDLETALTMIDKVQQDACERLSKKCKAVESLPVVANYNRLRDKEKAALGALVDAQCAVIGYPTRTMAEVRIKAAWLRDKYQGRSAEFMDEETDALLQSFFNLAR